ncbi:uncharacterized protein LOC119668358 [Teleopsis dalmanni]|uniref:uncharacterized protein LOC119668031 n=1 Tax=Teleopsis dalmanni TaxID=139649 RepID=UPI0018CC7C57|nr:uncharacterized protein LOC119668031 [Teleopsis dalmanni]XP_037933762.1 uncharacterized protein LOC119668358 [Teleopsis dalmanni]
MFLFWNRTDNNAPARTSQRTQNLLGKKFIEKLDALHDGAIRTGLVTTADLQEAYRKSREIEQNPNLTNIWYGLGIMAFIMVATPLFYEIITFLLSVRCFLPNNYLVIREATRPISDCEFCKGVNGPLILKNLTRDEFEPLAYSSQPIIIKNAVTHWPATKLLNFTFIKNLYESIPGALDEDCQFLHFRSDFKNLRDVLNMPPERANLREGDETWYVGWSNCHPVVLGELRKLYPRPHFLPADAEMPNTDYIFLGYEQGAFMHLDYIPRLMWQAQLQGNKSWILAPTPECDHICQSFSFYVEPGDAVLVDTRIWYHGTSIPKGQFALTIQSEYG